MINSVTEVYREFINKKFIEIVDMCYAGFSDDYFEGRYLFWKLRIKDKDDSI